MKREGEETAGLLPPGSEGLWSLSSRFSGLWWQRGAGRVREGEGGGGGSKRQLLPGGGCFPGLGLGWWLSFVEMGGYGKMVDCLETSFQRSIARFRRNSVIASLQLSPLPPYLEVAVADTLRVDVVERVSQLPEELLRQVLVDAPPSAH